MKVVTSAVIVMPPNDQWSQIQEIRAKHDKAYDRWMPHINLLYPFIPEEQFLNNLERLVNGLSSLSPFKLVFRRFDSFCHGRSYTMFMKPEADPADALITLQSKLEEVFPLCDDLRTIGDHGFAPHMTVGQFNSKVSLDRSMEDYLSKLVPIEFTVTHVHLIARQETDPFSVRHSVPLGCTDQSEFMNFTSLKAEKKSIRDSELDKFDPLKRQVIEKIEKWVVHQAEIKKLPKTQGAFKLATRSLCLVNYEISDVEAVYSKLLEEGYFTVDDKKNVKYKKPGSHKDIVRFKSNTEEAEALQKCRDWVYGDLNSPKTVTALKNCLKQLLTTKKMIDQDLVVLYFEKIGRMAFDYENITYL